MKAFINDVYNQPVHPFLDFRKPATSPFYYPSNLYWINEIDSAHPYESGFENKLWVVSEIILTNYVV